MQRTQQKWLLLMPLLLLIEPAQLPAEIIYNPTAFSHSVGTGDLGTGTTFFTADLPGANDLVMASFSYSGLVPASSFYQLNFLNYGGCFAAGVFESLYYAQSLNAGETWVDTSNARQYGADLSRMAQTGDSSFGLRSDPTYLPFWFFDTSNWSQVDYGYIALATTVTGSGASAQLNLIVSGYAYDNSGAKIAMAAVPEPSGFYSAAFGILGIVAMWHWRTLRACI